MPPAPMLQTRTLIDALADADAPVVIVGGMAAVLHGVDYVTADLDLCYDPSDDGRRRVARALSGLSPYPRGVDRGLPFVWDARTLRDTPLLTLATDAVDIALRPDVPGVGPYEAVAARSEPAVVFGRTLRVLSLDALVDAKRALGRPKDLMLLAHLDAIRGL